MVFLKRNILVVLIGSLPILVACNQDSKSVTPQTIVPQNSNRPTTETITKNEQKSDTIYYTLTLENRLYKVVSAKTGHIIKTELPNLGFQRIDSNTVIALIDNREDFLKLRELKLSLKKQVSTIANPDIQMDLNYFDSTINVNSLLPNIQSNHFSKKFRDWFIQQSFYSDYEKASKIEDGMKSYFYINDFPIQLVKTYFKVGDLVKKGEPLYEFIKPTNKLIYKVKLNRALPTDAIIINSKSKKQYSNYQVENGELRINLPLIPNFPKKIAIEIIQSKEIS